MGWGRRLCLDLSVYMSPGSLPPQSIVDSIRREKDLMNTTRLLMVTVAMVKILPALLSAARSNLSGGGQAPLQTPRGITASPAPNGQLLSLIMVWQALVVLIPNGHHSSIWSEIEEQYCSRCPTPPVSPLSSTSTSSNTSQARCFPATPRPNGPFRQSSVFRPMVRSSSTPTAEQSS